jgi:small conductance mechanosensitive channel
VKYSFQVLGGIIILVIGWIFSKFAANFVQKFLDKYHVDVTVKKFLIAAIRIAVMGFAVLLALGKFGVEIAPFIAGLSVVGLGTSLALQGPMSNYAAGIILIFTKPFKVGDIIEVHHAKGEVEDVSLSRTALRTVDGTLYIIPNKHIIGEIIHNETDLRRMDINIGISYKSDVDKAIGLMYALIQREPRVNHEPPPKIGIAKFGDSSIDLYARVWCKQGDYWDILFTLHKSIWDEFKKNQIEIPYPQRDIHLYQEKQLLGR